MPLDEALLVRRYRAVESARDRVFRAAERHFMPLLEKAKAAKDLIKLRSLLDRCPDQVLRLFIMDAIRCIEVRSDLRDGK